jgi:uncharacterized protein involved in exopolysaccharide biosynthesis
MTAPPPGEFRPIDLRRLVQPFRHRGPLLAAAILMPVAVVWTAAGQLPPTYRSSAQVLLERDRVELGEIADVLTAPVISDSATVSNEIAILLSTPVLEGAARRLGLLDARGMPVVVVRPAEGAVARILAALEHASAALGFAAPTRAGPVPDPTAAAAQVVDALRASLDVTRNLNAFVIDVVATAPHPNEAAALANAVVVEYLVAQERTKRATADRALAWMRGEIDDLRARIAGQNRRIQAQRRELLAAAVGDPATTANQLREVGNALAVARTEQADAESRLSELRAALAAADVTTAGEVIDTPELASVRRQLADLRQRLAAERASRGERRPVAAELQAQIASLTADARALVAQALERLDLDRRIRAERIEALRRESTSLQQVVLALEPAQVAITDLEREAAASQQLYVVLLSRLNEITAQKEAIAPDARVLNAAVPPEAPTGPRRGLYAALAGLAGVLGFAGAVLAADALGGRFESLGALEEATGLTVLAAVRRRPRPARLVDRDLGVLPAEDGVELALALQETSGACPLVALAPAAAGPETALLAARLVAAAERRGRRLAVIEAAFDAGPPTAGALRLPIHRIVAPDGNGAAAAAIAAAAAGCDAALLLLPPLSTSALAVAWARLADSCLVVVDGLQPETDPLLRLVARLRESGASLGGVVAVTA